MISLKELATAACKEFPNAASRTIARMLVKRHPKRFTSINQARESVRYARGNHGGGDRSRASAPRPNGHAGTVVMPPAVVESWEPFVIAGPARIVALSDIHVPYHDETALALAVQHAKKQKPDVLLLNGDVIDFYGVSRFEKDPSRRTPVEEIRLAVQLLRWLRQELPRARLVIKCGNHEERWDRYIWQSAPVLWELPQIRLDGILGYELSNQVSAATRKQVGTALSDHGIEFVTDQRPVLAGKLPILHGHELPKGISNPVNTARGAYLRTAHTILVGHGHRTSHHVEPDLFKKEVACWSTGCLCGLYPAYARVNKWNHGFAMIDVASDGQFEVENLRIVKGVVRSS